MLTGRLGTGCWLLAVGCCHYSLICWKWEWLKLAGQRTMQICAQVFGNIKRSNILLAVDMENSVDCIYKDAFYFTLRKIRVSENKRRCL
jgi:hypothetical protein